MPTAVRFWIDWFYLTRPAARAYIATAEGKKTWNHEARKAASEVCVNCGLAARSKSHGGEYKKIDVVGYRLQDGPEKLSVAYEHEHGQRVATGWRKEFRKLAAIPANLRVLYGCFKARSNPQREFEEVIAVIGSQVIEPDGEWLLIADWDGDGSLHAFSWRPGTQLQALETPQDDD